MLILTQLGYSLAAGAGLLIHGERFLLVVIDLAFIAAAIAFKVAFVHIAIEAFRSADVGEGVFRLPQIEDLRSLFQAGLHSVAGGWTIAQSCAVHCDLEDLYFGRSHCVYRGDD